MRCRTCDGAGIVAAGAVVFDQHTNAAGDVVVSARMFFPRGPVQHGPCPDCNGSGVGHCCDGICAQPEK
jgi:DnaJ-class molecular chaperone